MLWLVSMYDMSYSSLLPVLLLWFVLKCDTRKSAVISNSSLLFVAFLFAVSYFPAILGLLKGVNSKPSIDTEVLRVCDETGISICDKGSASDGIVVATIWLMYSIVLLSVMSFGNSLLRKSTAIFL